MHTKESLFFKPIRWYLRTLSQTLLFARGAEGERNRVLIVNFRLLLVKISTRKIDVREIV